MYVYIYIYVCIYRRRRRRRCVGSSDALIQLVLHTPNPTAYQATTPGSRFDTLPSGL